MHDNAFDPASLATMPRVDGRVLADRITEDLMQQLFVVTQDLAELHDQPTAHCRALLHDVLVGLRDVADTLRQQSPPA